MKSRLAILFCIFFMTLGCSKDNNQGSPSIKLVNYDAQVQPSGVFSAKLSYSQNGGNLSGDTLRILYHRYNRSLIPEADQRSDTLETYLAETPGAPKADVEVNLDWSDISYGINDENDTVDFSFVLIDLQGRHSDTVKTGKVIVLQ